MARLVAAYGSSHSPMLNSTLAEWLRYVELDEVRSFTVEPGTDLPYDGLLATAQKEDALLASPRDIERRHQAALRAMDTLRTLVHRAFANLRWHDISLGASSRASLMFQG